MKLAKNDGILETHQTVRYFKPANKPNIASMKNIWIRLETAKEACRYLLTTQPTTQTMAPEAFRELIRAVDSLHFVKTGKYIIPRQYEGYGPTDGEIPTQLPKTPPKITSPWGARPPFPRKFKNYPVWFLSKTAIELLDKTPAWLTESIIGK